MITKLWLQMLNKKAAVFLLALTFAFVVSGCKNQKHSLQDGLYTVEVELTGGSGKSRIASPASLEVKAGKAFLEIVWSSKNYDYMIVGNTKYLNETPGQKSTFHVFIENPFSPVKIIADTTSMSVPHEIEYEIKIVF